MGESRVGLLGEARVCGDAFAEVSLSLARQLAELQGLCLLLGGGGADAASLARVATRVADAAVRLDALEGRVEEELAAADEARALARALRAQQQARRQIATQLAAHSPDAARPAAAEAAEPSRAERLAGSEPAPGVEPTTSPLVAPTPADGAAAAAGEGGEPCHDRASPSIAVPSAQQLQTVPQYMRGRLTHDKLEQACEAVTRALRFKYETLATPRGKQGVGVYEMVIAWRDQECDEIGRQGRFVTVEDIIAHGRGGEPRGAAPLEVGALKSALQVLRFLGLLRLVGSGGVARYVC